MRGHIYSVFQKYDSVWEQHQAVLNLTKEPKLIEGANNSLESVPQSQSSDQSDLVAAYSIDDNFLNAIDFSEPPDYLETRKPPHIEDLGTLSDFDVNSFDSNRFEHLKGISFKLKQPVWQSFWSITRHRNV